MFLLFIFTLVPAYSQNTDEPDWILYRKGINFYNSRDFSEAFKYFREAAVKRDFPEAEYYIGRIFENEGDFPLALKQYERAESFSDSLLTENFINLIIIQKASVYKKLNRHNLYQKTMRELIKTTASEKRITEYMRLLPEKILSIGLDRLMYYYRLDGDEIINPSGELGTYYYTLSQDNNSLKFLTPAVSAVMSKAFLILREYDPQYSYVNLESFLKDAEKFDKCGKYLESTGFYKYLFYLSLTLHNYEKTDETFRLLKIICSSRYSGKYRDISGRIVRNGKKSMYIEKVKESLLLPVE